MTVLGMIFLLAGIILESLRRNSREIKRMLYLAVNVKAPTPSGDTDLLTPALDPGA